MAAQEDLEKKKEENLDDLVEEKKEEVKKAHELVRKAENKEKEQILGEIKEEKRLEEDPVKKMGLVRVAPRKKTTLGDIFFRKHFHPIWLVLILGAMAGGLIYALQYYGSLPNKVETAGQEVVKKQIEQTLLEASDSAEQEAEDDVKSLKAQVLNGTGTKGQAGKVKALIAETGIESIETGNADESDHGDAEVIFSKKVGDKTREKVLNKLKELFVKVDFVDAPQNDPFDIVITTGTEKD